MKMKALIQKDIYVLWKQMRVLLLIMLVLMVSNGSFGDLFVVIWCAMLPYTAMAYDERCKWDQMAAMMPYSTQDLVLSKYVLGWLFMAAAAALALVSQVIIRGAGLPLETGLPGDVVLGVAGGLSILAVTLPLMLRFGVERGRMVMFVMVILVCGLSGGLSYIMESGGWAVLSGPVQAMGLVVALVLTAISVPLAMKLYRRER